MWRTRTPPSGRLFRGMAEGGAQLGQREWLVQVGPAERFEELERVAAHRVAGGEDDPFGHPRVLAGELGVHPAPGRVSRVMRPPCSFMMPWQMESPSPVPSPSRLVVKNGSKTRAASSSVIPGPESVTLTAMLSPTRRAVIQIRPDGASLAIAWHALLITFTNTCLIWFAFTSTSGSPGSTSTVASTLCAIS